MQIKAQWQNGFHPNIVNWFENTFVEPTAIQFQAWQAIAKLQDVLISSPTGSGKTCLLYTSDAADE